MLNVDFIHHVWASVFMQFALSLVYMSIMILYIYDVQQDKN